MINSSDYTKLLNSFDIGASVAEQDTALALKEARIETAAFVGLAQDTIDLIRGTKGSGKSALFLIFSLYLKDFLLEKYNTVIVNGVEPQGDPIFQSFHDAFEDLDEIEFQNFWRIYFVSLIDRYFIEDPKFSEIKSKYAKEIQDFKNCCRKARIPQIEQKSRLQDIVALVLKVCKNIKITQTYDHRTGTVKTGIEYSPSTITPEEKAKAPVFLNEIHESLLALLNKANLNIWVMLDRLDEVFLRRTPIEKKALRALLQTTRSFPTSRIRIKIFLRDDILDYITDENGFTGLTHVTSRASDILTWNKTEILHLIVKRIFISDTISLYYQIDKNRLNISESYREECFYKVFPRQVEKGAKHPHALDWIFSHCQDGRGVVTPRDVIDLLTFAKSRQQELFSSQPVEQEFLISSLALKHGYLRLSERKKETYLKAEFPHFWTAIIKLEGSKAEHNRDSLRKLFGDDVDIIIKNLCSIGFFQYMKSSDSYIIPFLFRVGLKLKQGKAFKKK